MAGFGRWFAIAVLLGFALSIAGCCCCAIPPEPPDTTPTPMITPVWTPTPQGQLAEWTVIVYLDGDNNLEEAALRDINEMEAIGSSPDVNYIVQLDRSDEYDTSDGDWSGTKRYRVERDSDMESISTVPVQDLGEVNMGDPDTLVDFATWSMQNYPAKRYMLVVWDHGAGWPSIAVDEGSDDDAITLPELKDAFSRITTQNSGNKIDLIGFDACLMAMFEVSVQVAPYGKVLVASEETIPASGWDYRAIAEALNSQPTMSERQLASIITSSYLSFYQTIEKDQTVTLAAIDLEAVGALKGSIDRFSRALQGEIATEEGWKNVASAKDNAESYGSEDWGYVDLKDFASIVGNFADGELLAACADVASSIDDAVIYNVYGDQHMRSAGISIDTSTDAKSSAVHYAQLDSSRTTKWTGFIDAYYGGLSRGVEKEAQLIDSGGSPIDVRDMSLTSESMQAGDTNTVSVVVEGENIARANMMVFEEVLDPTGDYYVLIDYIEYDPPAYELEDGSTIQYWLNGTNDIEVDWDGYGMAVEDDEGFLSIAVTPLDRNSSMYSVEGIYTRSNGRQVDASLVFDMRTYELIYIWDYDSVSEIIPEQGERFTAKTLAFDLEEGSEIFEVEYEDLIWGTTGWMLSRRPLEGNYVLAFNAETFYENSDLEVAMVEVRE